MILVNIVELIICRMHFTKMSFLKNSLLGMLKIFTAVKKQQN